MRRFLLTVLAAIAVLALSAQPAAAQCKLKYKYVFYPPYSDLVLDCQGSSQPEGKAKKRKATKPKKATGAQLRSLRYKPSSRVNKRVHDYLVKRLATGTQSAQIEQMIHSNGLLSQTTKPIRDMGWSTRDLGDRYAHAYIVTWLVVNGERSTTKRVDAAVRKELRNRLALGKLRKWSDARQQAYAERLSSYAVVIAGTLNSYRKSGDETGARIWGYDANRLAGQPFLFGENFLRVKLTRRGVVDR